MSPLDRLTPLWPKKDEIKNETKQETKAEPPTKARRCWHVQGWRSSAAMARHGGRPSLTDLELVKLFFCEACH
jgi:hypothetical protein